MDSVFPQQPSYSAFVNADFGYTLLDLLNKTHLRVRQISDNKVGSD